MPRSSEVNGGSVEKVLGNKVGSVVAYELEKRVGSGEENELENKVGFSVGYELGF